MEDAKKQLADKLKSANNVLVTVSRNPSVDQLSALLGLTLVLNKQGKHAAAVYSGQTPSTIEFLKPEETIEKNTDSLRDFIIALDKNKADKLRYKVEDDVVRIFITPYRTSISKDDFEFSQGDFNVDVVVALGVQQQEDLDEAIISHGRILHDATVTSINLTADGGLGVINWHVPEASSLSELVTQLADQLGPNPLDEQIATALLTGIVAETDRFSNNKTSSETMSASAQLMQAGANQQLVASKLQEAATIPSNVADDGGVKVNSDAPEPDKADGAMEIDHDTESKPSLDLPAPDESAVIDTAASNEPMPETSQPDAGPGLTAGSRMITEPPMLGGQLTANSGQTEYDPATDPFSMPVSETPQLLNRDSTPIKADTVEPPAAPAQPEPPTPPPAPEDPKPDLTPPPPSWVPQAPAPLNITADEPATSEQTLSQIEESVHSPHLDPTQLDAARSEVDQAISGAEAAGATPPTPIQALNAQPMGDALHLDEPAMSDDDKPSGAPMPPPSASDPNAPPPVPPPIPFQFGNTPPPQ